MATTIIQYIEQNTIRVMKSTIRNVALRILLNTILNIKIIDTLKLHPIVPFINSILVERVRFIDIGLMLIGCYQTCTLAIYAGFCTHKEK